MGRRLEDGTLVMTAAEREGGIVPPEMTVEERMRAKEWKKKHPHAKPKPLVVERSLDEFPRDVLGCR